MITHTSTWFLDREIHQLVVCELGYVCTYTSILLDNVKIGNLKKEE